ncbi:MAG: CDP-alcohol phosphatidyltransferase family protein [Actinomycetota bacterium]|nr:CDP-alcohol phosphatidyltransferase family protein [Actinomycetota bacterium]
MFDGRFRHAVDGVTTPIGKALASAGVAADVLTVAGLAMSVGAAVAIGAGSFAIGVVLMVATGLPDLFDGPVAKATGTVSIRGAFLDSVADRVADAFLYGGLAWYLAARHHGTVAVLPFAIVAVTGFISYERAKAELLGLPARGGLMERAERFIALGVVLIAAAIDPAALVPLLVVFLGLVTATACGRFARIWRAASAGVAATTSGAAPTAGTAGHAHLPAAAGHARTAASDDLASVVDVAEDAGGFGAPGRSAAEPDEGRDPAAVPAAAGGGQPAPILWRRGRVDSRWRSWRAARARTEGPRVWASGTQPAGHRRIGADWRAGLQQRRSGEPWARWRARRAGAPVSRAGGARRERRVARTGSRPGRRSGAGSR